eukprot:CAMPEP_0177656632 /NCGR_PEP_ID=MMETSP0447-20121125/15688_1 /TAXON_ID=0 /ORGANISM="Stygamoeba regulata, Strain BSH-02190019" /LENGTH=143 /DNA_ID=CAMNT_0019160799 /DNA_START=60 /DNA_END=491 /DNA_ORIENTATION=-
MADVSDPKIAAGYQAVRSDADPTNWTLFGYEGNNKIVHQGQGSGGLSELVAQLKDDQVQYGFFNIITGDSESRRTKFVLLTWIGPGVGALKKARTSVHKASVKEICRDFAVELQSDDRDDFAEDVVLDRVTKASGANYNGQGN